MKMVVLYGFMGLNMVALWDLTWDLIGFSSGYVKIAMENDEHWEHGPFIDQVPMKNLRL